MQNTEQNAVLLRLAREYGDSVVRMCCVYLKDYHLAQDVAQETFLQAARKYGALARTDSEKAVDRLSDLFHLHCSSNSFFNCCRARRSR